MRLVEYIGIEPFNNVSLRNLPIQIMKNATSRRLFLQNSAMATTGIALLSTGIVNALTNENPYEGHNPFAEEKTDLRTTIFGEHIRVRGIIYDETGSIPVEDATIEVWHLSPNSNKFRHRTKLCTNSTGEYNFITDFPNNEPGYTSKIYFKITHNHSSYFTDLSLNSFGVYISSKHWEENQSLGKKLFPKEKKNFGTRQINFNISI